MPLFTARERRFADAITRLSYGNPFLPERIAAERDALGDEFDDADLVWSASKDGVRERPNVRKLAQRVEQFCPVVRARLIDGKSVRPGEAVLYDGLVMYLIYYRHHAVLERAAADTRAGRSPAGMGATFAALQEELDHFFGVLPGAVPDAAHLLACFFQIRRAFEEIFRSIIGTSLASANLRAAIWQSIFTHDIRRYRRVLFDKTADFTTLVTGPSGTGKELVARAISAGRYVPFDAKRKAFVDKPADSFFPLNLSALSPMLVESELFGHRRGAFTGAVEDRPGYLEVCPPLGTVFLDEIGELDPAIQVKLLRVLQTRTFQRLGDTRTLPFRGKIIAATHRDLPALIRRGQFRQDFYYRLCADLIVTPSLRDQIGGSRDELRTLIRFVAQRLLPGDEDTLTDEVLTNIDRHLGPDYAWPGNFRELEQCVRNVLIRGHYPGDAATGDTPEDALTEGFAAGRLTADELLQCYCRHVYAQSGSYDAAAKRLKLDRRTVKAYVVGRKGG